MRRRNMWWLVFFGGTFLAAIALLGCEAQTNEAPQDAVGGSYLVSTPEQQEGCELECDQGCKAAMSDRGISNEESQSLCCQTICPPPACYHQCDSACIDGEGDTGALATISDEWQNKCCHVVPCPEPEPAVNTCPLECDETCKTNMKERGLTDDEIESACCTPVCPPPTCYSDCDPSCMGDETASGENMEKCCKVVPCPEPEPCPLVCDEACETLLKQRGITDVDEIQEVCCEEVCPPPAIDPCREGVSTGTC